MACTNDKVLVEGRCDYCDTRCPFYTTSEMLVRAIYARLPSEVVDDILTMAHEQTMHYLENTTIFKTEV